MRYEERLAIRTPRWAQHRFQHRPLIVVQFPVSCHRASRLSQSTHRIAQIRLGYV